MTLENFTSVFQSKSQEDIKIICTSLLKFAVTYKEMWITVGICALIGVLILLTRKELGRTFRKSAVFSLVIYATYMIGTLGMYLFSMQGGEAISLAGIQRYTKSILIAILYLNMVPAVMLISELSEKRLMTSTVTACVFVSFFVGMCISSGSITTVVQYKQDLTERNWIDDTRKKYDVPMDSTYCFLILSEDNPSYFYFMGRYIFQSSNVTVKVIESEDDFNEISQKYVFVFDQGNEIIQDWIQRVYPEQVGNEVIIQPVGKNQ